MKDRRKYSILVRLVSTSLVAVVTFAAPIEHRIEWPGVEEQLFSAHYSGRLQLPSKAFVFPWQGETPAVSAHYWYVESERTPEADPIIMWIQGGPGGSSIGGGWLEMGPLSLDSRSLATQSYKETGVPTPVRNAFSWTKFAGLLMVDYADIGFSTCESAACEWDDAKACNSLVDFLEVFFSQAFPEHAGRPLWIAGESYAGILVTVTAAIIDHRGPGSPVALGGVLHGNGAVGHFAGGAGLLDAWPDGFNTNDTPEDARHHIDFFFRAGLVSEKLYAETYAKCGQDWWRPTALCSETMRRMNEAMGNFEESGSYWNVYDIYDSCSDMPHFRSSARRTSAHGSLERSVQAEGDALDPEHSSMHYCGGHAATAQYMNLEAVRLAMHIPTNLSSTWSPSQDLAWNCSNDDEKAFAQNFTSCEISDYRPLIKHVASLVPFLVYSGDVDAQLPHTATERWTSELGFEEIEAASSWAVRRKYVGGYVTRYEHGFTYATVKGAGHIVPSDRPEAAQELVQRFVETQRLAHLGAAVV